MPREKSLTNEKYKFCQELENFSQKKGFAKTNPRRNICFPKREKFSQKNIGFAKIEKICQVKI